MKAPTAENVTAVECWVLGDTSFPMMRFVNLMAVNSVVFMALHPPQIRTRRI